MLWCIYLFGDRSVFYVSRIIFEDPYAGVHILIINRDLYDLLVENQVIHKIKLQD